MANVGQCNKQKARRHHQHQGKYLRQRARTANNKEKAWGKHLVKHPNDLQSKAKIKELRKIA
jgi:hypothetical protein